MREITIVGLKNIVVTWLINPCYSYIITTSTKKMLTPMLMIERFFHISYCGFSEPILAYLFSETRNERI